VVKIEDQTSAVSVNTETGYGIPKITSLSNHTDMNTAGNDIVYLNGNNFGPVGILSSASPYEEFVWYGTSIDNYKAYKVSNCQVDVAHTRIRCASLASKNNVNRTALRWIVKIEDQTSAVSMNTETRYGIPSITSLSNHIDMSTTGGTTVYLNGTNFGPASALSTASPYDEMYGMEHQMITINRIKFQTVKW
jgi:hypothetical protein